MDVPVVPPVPHQLGHRVHLGEQRIDGNCATAVSRSAREQQRPEGRPQAADLVQLGQVAVVPAGVLPLLEERGLGAWSVSVSGSIALLTSTTAAWRARSVS